MHFLIKLLQHVFQQRGDFGTWPVLYFLRVAPQRAGHGHLGAEAAGGLWRLMFAVVDGVVGVVTGEGTGGDVD